MYSYELYFYKHCTFCYSDIKQEHPELQNSAYFTRFLLLPGKYMDIYQDRRYNANFGRGSHKSDFVTYPEKLFYKQRT